MVRRTVPAEFPAPLPSMASDSVTAALNSALRAAETLSGASGDATSFITSAQHAIRRSERFRDGGDDRRADELLDSAESLLRGGPPCIVERAAFALSADSCYRESLTAGLERWFATRRAEASERAAAAGTTASGPEATAGRVDAAAHAAALLYLRANGEFTGAEAELELALISAFRSARRQFAAAAPVGSEPCSSRRSRSPRPARDSRC